jgi:hypothetical protein
VRGTDLVTIFSLVTAIAGALLSVVTWTFAARRRKLLHQKQPRSIYDVVIFDKEGDAVFRRRFWSSRPELWRVTQAIVRQTITPPDEKGFESTT